MTDEDYEIDLEEGQKLTITADMKELADTEQITALTALIVVSQGII
jgi:hypothetical protein